MYICQMDVDNYMSLHSKGELRAKDNLNMKVEWIIDFIVSNELAEKVDSKGFVVGNHKYTKGYQIV